MFISTTYIIINTIPTLTLHPIGWINIYMHASSIMNHTRYIYVLNVLDFMFLYLHTSVLLYHICLIYYSDYLLFNLLKTFYV